MNDESTNVGTVRRRLRPENQHSQESFETNGDAKTNGARKKNGTNGGAHAEFTRETFYDRPPKGGPQGESRSEPRAEPRQSRRRDRRSEYEPSPRRRRGLPWREVDFEAPLFRCPFDPWRLYGAVKRNINSIMLTAGVLTIAGFLAAILLVPYKMSLPLIRKTSNAVHTEGALPNQFTPHEYSDGTLYAFMKSPDVLRGVAAKSRTNALLAPLHITPDMLSKAVTVVPVPNPDFVLLQMKTFAGMRAMSELINMYGREVVEYTRTVQQKNRVSSTDICKSSMRSQTNESRKLPSKFAICPTRNSLRMTGRPMKGSRNSESCRTSSRSANWSTIASTQRCRAWVSSFPIHDCKPRSCSWKI